MPDVFDKESDGQRTRLNDDYLYAALYAKSRNNIAKLNYPSNLKNLAQFVNKDNLSI